MPARNLHDQLVPGARTFIVNGEFLPENAGLNADDGIGARVEGIASREDRCADRKLFQVTR